MMNSKHYAERHGKKKIELFLIKRLDDKNGKKYRICNESYPEYKIFNPQIDPL